MKNIHIGSIIKQKVAESAMTIKEFAEQINCDRTTVYDIFKRKSIDTEQLIKISGALNYNFFEEVYLKQNNAGAIAPPSEKVFIAVEIDKNMVEKLDLPAQFLRLLSTH